MDTISEGLERCLVNDDFTDLVVDLHSLKEEIAP